MKRTLLSLMMAVMTLSASAQTEQGLERVSSDELVRHLRKEYSQNIYFRKADEDQALFTIRASKAKFVEEALGKLRAAGYSVSEFEGAWFISKEKAIRSTALPEGFFKAETKATEPQIEEEAQEVTLAGKIYEIGQKGMAKGAKAFVHGYIKDAATGEPLVGVAVYDKSGAFTQSDAYGFYRIALPLGESLLSLSGYSLEDMQLKLDVMSDGGLDITMHEKVIALKGAVATADAHSMHRSTKLGVESVHIATIKTVPTVFGEADVLKVVLTLPGVKTAGEGAGGFNVRGGASDQNLILFNEGTIYNPNHMFGVISAFNADVISDVELYKSSIPAEFGGRISSVLDIHGKSGNASKVSGSVGIGILTSSLALEGPIKKGRTTFTLGARTTYSDWMLKLLPKNSSYKGGSAGFSDINAGISHKINAKNSLHAYGYFSRDKFAFSGDTTFRYSNVNASMKWRHQFDERSSMSVTGGYDRFGSSYEDGSQAYRANMISTSISQAYAKARFSTTIGDHNLIYGASGIYYMLNPGERTALTPESSIQEQKLGDKTGAELALHISDTWAISPSLSFDYGTRLVGYMAMDPSKIYFYPEIRLSGKYSLRDNLSLKAGLNTMSQNLHMISNNTSISPMDSWRLSGEKLRPQTGWQGAGGLYWTVGQDIDLSLEGYYKRMNHYPDYKSGAILVMNGNLEDDLVETTGKAYGVEVMMKKPHGKLNGWLSYTWSRSLLKESQDRGIYTINAGNWYPAAYDKPHEFKAVMNYKFTHRYSLSMNLEYSTGRPVTLPIGKYMYAGAYAIAYSDRNAYRIPDYFRMDLAFIIEPGHYLKQLAHMSFTVGVYNVTGRKNAYSVYYSYDADGNLGGHMLSVFAVPIPYVNFNLKF